MIKLILIPIILIFVILSAFFSAAETAYTSVTKIKINHASSSGYKAILMKNHLNNYGSILTTILIGNNFSNIAATTLLSYLLSTYFVAGEAALISTLTMTPILILFGELIPKIIARKYPIWYLHKIAFAMNILYWLFMPITFFMKKMIKEPKTTISEDELQSIIKIAKKEKVLEHGEAELVKNALNFDSTSVKEAMIPIEEAIFINSTFNHKQILSVFKKSGNSRLIVKENEKYLGYIHFKNFFWNQDKSLSELIIKMKIIPENEFFHSALRTFKISTKHIMLVCKENDNKKIIGILTIEDILEQLVGDIYDEYDKKENIFEISYDEYRILGKTKMIEIKKIFNEIDFGGIKNINIQKWLAKAMNIKKISINNKFVYKNLIVFTVISLKNREYLIEVGRYNYS